MVSLVINIGQVMTSIQDMTVTTVPRLAAVGVILFFLMPWMLHHLVAFTINLFGDFRAVYSLREQTKLVSMVRAYSGARAADWPAGSAA